MTRQRRSLRSGRCGGARAARGPLAHLSALAALTAFGAGLAGCQESPSDAFDTRPVGSLEDVAALAERDDLNVVFVLIDTLRADRMGSYGYERATTPVLDYFAGRGLRFANHRAQSSWTKTSMASL